MKTRNDLLEQIHSEHEQWHTLLTEIGDERMEQPGPMGAWTFKDLVAHLTAWRDHTIDRIEAGPIAEPVAPWPSHLIDDDAINAWVYEHNRVRPLGDVLADADHSFDRLASAVTAVPDEDLTTPARFTWMEGRPLVEADFFDHHHDEHEPAIRAWLGPQ